MSVLRVSCAARRGCVAALPAALRRQRRTAADEAEKHPTQQGIEEFIGTHILEKGLQSEHPDPGRAWGMDELKVKSYEDLRRIWFLLLKERNQLLSVELFYQMQEETLGQFPHQTRFDRVAASMRRIKSVMEERHNVSEKVAWKEFVKRIEQQYYNYPPGPAAPAGYGVKEREVVFYSKHRVVSTPADYDETEDEVFLRLKDRFELILNTDVADVKEVLTEEGKTRHERAEFLRLRLRAVSRDLLGHKQDLVQGWREERAELREKGPFKYTVKLSSAEEAESVLSRAQGKEDEVLLMEALPSEDVPLHAAFLDEDHLLVCPTLVPTAPVPNPMYEHIMAREDHHQRSVTRPAPVIPFPFSEKPYGVDPYTNELRDKEHTSQQTMYESSGMRSTPYVDAPHPHTKLLHRPNVPGEERTTV